MILKIAHQQVGHIVELNNVDAHDFENVDNKSENVADEEDKDDGHEHRCQTNFFLLQMGQAGTLRVCATYLQIKTSHLQIKTSHIQIKTSHLQIKTSHL